MFVVMLPDILNLTPVNDNTEDMDFYYRPMPRHTTTI